MKLRAIIFSALAALACSTLISACTTPGRQHFEALVAGPDRSAADLQNDIRRKPADMLAFIAPQPGMVALDLSAGGGYTTELLARAVGPTGRVYGQSAPRDAANPPPRPTAPEGVVAPTTTVATTRSLSVTAPVRQTVADRAKKPGLSNIVPVTRRFEDPVPPEVIPGTLDLATLMFNYHDLGYMGVDRAAMNSAVFAALKPGGIYVIADHAGRPGTGISESGTLHRIEEVFLRREIEAAGFRLAASGNFLRNPADPRDRNIPEPPQAKDEFVLKFIKP